MEQFVKDIRGRSQEALSLRIAPCGQIVLDLAYTSREQVLDLGELLAHLIVRMCSHRVDSFPSTVGERIAEASTIGQEAGGCNAVRQSRATVVVSHWWLEGSIPSMTEQERQTVLHHEELAREGVSWGLTQARVVERLRLRIKRDEAYLLYRERKGQRTLTDDAIESDLRVFALAITYLREG
jgi:hypothetical protein